MLINQQNTRECDTLLSVGEQAMEMAAERTSEQRSDQNRVDEEVRMQQTGTDLAF